MLATGAMVVDSRESGRRRGQMVASGGNRFGSSCWIISGQLAAYRERHRLGGQSAATLVSNFIVGYLTVFLLLLSLMVLQGIYVLAEGNQLRRVRRLLGASSITLLMLFIAVGTCTVRTADILTNPAAGIRVYLKNYKESAAQRHARSLRNTDQMASRTSQASRSPSCLTGGRPEALSGITITGCEIMDELQVTT